MVVSCLKNIEQNHNFMIAIKTFETVEKLKYLVMTITNQNYIHEEIKSRCFGNACYLSFLCLSSHLLSKNAMI